MKTKRFGYFLSALLAASPLFGAGAYDNMGELDKQKLMEQHYAKAIEDFSQGNYAKAVSHWEEILKIDSEQSSPREMIRQARVKLSEELAPVERVLLEEAKFGRYEAAHAKAKELVAKDPANEKFTDYKGQLEKIAALRAQETGGGRSGALIRRALYVSLTDDDQAKFAVNALRYARDLNPKHPQVSELAAFLEDLYPEVAKKEIITPGMSVVEHKLFIALNHIYEGRYDLSIFDCNEVLELEPDNVLALKRKGSAYFALKQKEKAREIWLQALKRAPEDPEIKKFLAEN